MKTIDVDIDRVISKDHIISKEDAELLYQLEENDLGPTDVIPEEDYNNFLKNVIGKTIWKYCLWRYPDNPKTQFNFAVKILSE